MIIFARILSVILGLIVISKTYLDYKKKYDGATMFAFWVITWLIVIFLSIYPAAIEIINRKIGENGTGTGLNTFFGSAFVFLLFVTYRVYTKANRLERKIHDMVMKLGLREISNK